MSEPSLASWTMTESKSSRLGGLGVTCRDQTLGTLCSEVVRKIQVESVYGGRMKGSNLADKNLLSTLLGVSKGLC